MTTRKQIRADVPLTPEAQGLSRRDFLRITGGSLAGFALMGTAGCGGRFGEEGDPYDLVVGYQASGWPGAASGNVVAGKELWKEYLPENSTLKFESGLQGSVLVNRMVAGKMDMAYLGDMPSLVATSKRETGDIRLISAISTSQFDCSVGLVADETPQFDDPREAIKWMDGKAVATSKGACTDYFAQTVFEKENVKPKNYLNQSLEVIQSNFANNKIDAAFLWEATPTLIDKKGTARHAVNGSFYDFTSVGYLAVRNELLEQRPDIVKGWLQAELDAQQYVADESNSNEVANILAGDTSFSKEILWEAVYGEAPGSEDKPKVEMPFVFTPEVDKEINNAWKFLHEIGNIQQPEPLEGVARGELAQEILGERGLKSPVGGVEALPKSEYKSE